MSDTVEIRTPSQSVSVELIPRSESVLVVSSGESYTVAAGTTETYERAIVDGTLDVDGGLVLG